MKLSLEFLVAKRLAEPLLGAAWVKYPGWYQERAMRAPLTGPFAAFRPLVDDLTRFEREERLAALATAGLPEIAVLAVTRAGVHVLQASGLTGQPGEQVTFAYRGSYRAWHDVRPLLIRVGLQLPDRPSVLYETSRLGLSAANARGVDAVLTASRDASQGSH